MMWIILRVCVCYLELLWVEYDMCRKHRRYWPKAGAKPYRAIELRPYLWDVFLP